MYLCYVDESGDSGPLVIGNKQTHPVFVIAGLMLPALELRTFTHEFLELKRTFFPEKFSAIDSWHDGILQEIKGSELRKSLGKKANHTRRRHVLAFSDAFLTLLKRRHCKIWGRVYVKEPGKTAEEFHQESVYTFSIQRIFATFQSFLAARDSFGVVISDARTFQLDRQVAHSVFTQKFKAGGDAFPNIVEMPTFGRSDNHGGLQAADYLCSGLIYPMAIHAYCLERSEELRNAQVQPGYGVLRERFGKRLAELQYRYPNPDGEVLSNGRKKREGGITVSNPYREPGGKLFKSENTPASSANLARLLKRWG